MLRIGVTGGIGAGKSTVCRIFAVLGVPIYDSDLNAKRLMVNDPELVGGIKKLLGEQAYMDGELNRVFVAEKIFNDKQLLKGMNAIVHPAVIADFVRWAEQMERQGEKYVIHESALLFESGLSEVVDYSVTVSAPLQQRIERTVGRDGVNEGKVRERIANQMKESQREALSDFVVDNSDAVLLVPQVLKLHKLFAEESRREAETR